MAGMFSNFGNDPKIKRQMLKSRYGSARLNLLLMIIFSSLNLLMLSTGSGLYFLFSATLPYFITSVGMFSCGRYPDEYYKQFENEIEFMDGSLFFVLLAISILIIAIYLLLWFFSKDGKKQFLTVALVMLAIDTAIHIMIYGFGALIDLALHIWVIVMLVMGIKAETELRAMGAEDLVMEGGYTDISEDYESEDYESDEYDGVADALPEGDDGQYTDTDAGETADETE